MYKVLLVEDEATVREGIVQKINWADHGFQLTGACENGQQAMELLQAEPVEVIITDINMPVMDGLELAKQVQENWPGTVVILLTGFSDFSYAQAAIKYRVHEYILKPVTARQLRELLDKLYNELVDRATVPDAVAAMKSDVDKAKMVMRRQFLQSLLAGELSQERWQQGAVEYGLDLPEPPYGVLLAGGQNAKDRADAILQTLAEKLIGKKVELFPAEDGRLLLIYSGVSSQEIIKIVRKNSESCGIQMSAALGEEQNALQGLPQSLQTAKTAWEHLYRLPPGTYIQAAAIPPTLPEKIHTGPLRRALLSHLRIQDEDGVEKEFGLFEKMLQEAPLTRSELVHHLNKLTLRLGEYAEEASLVPQGVTQESTLQAIAQSGSFAQGCADLKKYLNGLVAEDKKRSNSISRQAAAAVEYIKENYASPTLSLQQITQHLSVSTSYFSSIFKTHTGTTFIDYLTRVRIEEAIKLMVTTDCKNYEIAARVGYDDPGYFGSIFKKFTGMNPSEYRKNSRTKK